MPLKLPVDLAVGSRLVTSLPRHLRRPVTTFQARQTLARRFRHRNKHFLARVRSILDPRTGSPTYRELFRWSGCEYSDIAAMVQRENVEAALQALQRAGVYMNVDELKGRTPIVRGGRVWDRAEGAMGHPQARPTIMGQTSGSRGGTPVYFSLDFIRDGAVDLLAFLDAVGGTRWRKALWITPGGAAQFSAITMSSFGDPVDRWFTQVRPDDPGLHPRYRWSSRVIGWTSRLAGHPIPSPAFVPVSDPTPIVDWLATTRRRGETPFLSCFSSAAVLICQAALAKGADISGSQLIPSGEPFTAARRAILDEAGVTSLPRYGAMDAGLIAHACLGPAEPDETHVASDLVAVVQPEKTLADTPAPLYLTSLSPNSPSVLLNTSLGDTGVLTKRACGCPLELLGWKTHLHSVRSAEKLTAAGTTLLDVDIVRILEQDLPRAFGGTAMDYQLVEEEREKGEPSIRLLVAPCVGCLDENEVARVFRQAVAAAGGAEHVMMRIWEEGGTLHVERRAPYATASGKILHMHRGS